MGPWPTRRSTAMAHQGHMKAGGPIYLRGGGGTARRLQAPPKSFRKTSPPFNILIVRHVNQIFGNALVLTSKHESSRSFRKLPKALSYFLNGFASRLGPVHFSDTRTFEKYSESPFGPMQAKVLLISLFSSSWHSKCFFFTTVRLA